jgi:putative transposase
MGSVTTENRKAATAVVDDSSAVVPAQAGPADEQAAAAEAIAEALDPALVARLAAQARAQGVQLLGRGGVLQQLTKRFLEAALEAEMDAHLGYDKHDPAGRTGGNSRNGKRGKTLLTEVGPVDIVVPRDRDGSFTPTIVPKRSRRLGGVEDLVVSLSAKGLTHGEICAHLAEVYGAEVSKDRITAITDRVMDGMAEWQNRPLDPVYPVIFIDCIHVKIRDGQVANRPIYVALAVTVDGGRDILGLWAGDGGEGAKWWLRVLTEIRNRGAGDVCMLVCDGLKGLPDAIGEVWPAAVVQTCIIHLIRASLRYASKADWGVIAAQLKPIYTAPTEQAALDAFAEFSTKWERKYPAIIRLWTNAWAEMVPFLGFDVEIRRIVCSTNAIESLNARLRRAVNARGHFPTEQAALKVLYLAITSLDPTGKGRARWSNRWKAALNAFDITFDGRVSAGRR